MIPFTYANQELAFPCGMDKPRSVFTPMLAGRHEGGTWQWIDNQQPFIPFGPPGSYYATGGVPLHNEPFVRGDELLIFFNAFSRGQQEPSRFGTRSIGVATLRRDGFAGLTSSDDKLAGRLITQPLQVAGRWLWLNVEQRGPAGRVTTAIRDEQGAEIPGYGMADAWPIVADGVRCPVAFRTHTDLQDLAGRHVRIAVDVHGPAVVYAVAFGDCSRK